MTVTALTDLEKTLHFVESMGIGIVPGDGGDEFLPGITIRGNKLIINYETLAYPGDILHEAGHIAVVPPEERPGLTSASIAKRKMRDGEEMAATAWAYAATVHLDLPAAFIFHEKSYLGGGPSLAENFEKGYYFGVPMLQWWGMCVDKRFATDEQPAYPAMINWIRS